MTALSRQFAELSVGLEGIKQRIRAFGKLVSVALSPYSLVMRFLKGLPKPVCVVLMLFGVLVITGTWILLRNQREAQSIRQRYEVFWKALNDEDEAVTEALMARVADGSGFVNLEWIRNYGGPLDEKSRVQVSGSTAWVVPYPIYHFGVLPGGDCIAAIKVDGEWFFTGRITID